MNFLGIDYGSQRVGLALANDQAKIATPLTVLANDRDLLPHLHQVLSEEGIEEVVVGLPRGLDGQETAQTRIAREFVESAKASMNVTFHLQDEALSTHQALERIRQHKRSGGPQVDSEAAAIILQDYLDNL